MNPLPHLMLADAVWGRLELLPGARGHLLLGAIAPDAHRVTPELDYRLLHFRRRSRVGERFQDFLYDYLAPALRTGGADEQAFRMGYTCHIAGDAVWRRMIRAELPELWAGCLNRSSPDGRLLRDRFQWDCDAADRHLAQTHPSYVAELRRLLRSADPHYDVKPLTSLAINHWVGLVTTSGLPPPAPPASGDAVISHDFVLRAVDAAREEALAVIGGQLRKIGTEPHFH